MKTTSSVFSLLPFLAALALFNAPRAAAQSPGNTNRPPTVQIVTPADDESFPAPADIHIAAHATDMDGHVATVEFFNGATSLGVTTNNPLAMNPVNPFQVTWSNVPAGQYTLFARATDDRGAVAWSPGVHILVGSSSNNTHQAVVNIYVVDAQGREIPEVPPGMGMPQLYDPAVFRVTRSGGTNFDLPVYYQIGGSAMNGTDYESLSGQVTIPAGAVSAQIEVAVIDDLLVEGTESVMITVEPPVCILIFPPPPECYRVGQNNKATASILDNESPPPTNNIAPSVRITAPPNGAGFPAPAEISINAETIDPDGYASTVEFFAIGARIGESSIVFIREPPPGEPILFEFLWSNVPAGDYTLTASTTDDRGAKGFSSPVHITVGHTNAPPTNQPVRVNIVARDAFGSEGTNHFGTNNPAVFVVSRSGYTNSALTISYTISGTASNGVDYESIPNSVTIPAGRRSARITINPIDDQEREKVETVLLSLLTPSPAANLPFPGWNVGFPRHAAAIIVDNDHPRPHCARLPDSMFHLCLPHTNGFCFRLDASTNLVHWVPVCTNIVVDGAVHFVDPDAAPLPQRFYRVNPAPGQPED